MESSSKKRRGDATKQVILHVFVGGESGVQQGFFKSALAVVLSKIKKGDIKVLIIMRWKKSSQRQGHQLKASKLL